MSNFNIYYRNQIGGAPLATIPAESAKAAIKQYRSESPYPVRRDAVVATAVLRR
jgi:hypothetical protein